MRVELLAHDKQLAAVAPGGEDVLYHVGSSVGALEKKENWKQGQARF